MSKRLDDTKAVQAMAPYESQHEHYSRTVRKIDNGYVTTHHGSMGCANSPNGPTSQEVFTSTHPDKLDGEMARDGSAMKRAVDYMKK